MCPLVCHIDAAILGDVLAHTKEILSSLSSVNYLIPITLSKEVKIIKDKYYQYLFNSKKALYVLFKIKTTRRYYAQCLLIFEG